MPSTLRQHDHADVLTLHGHFLGGIERAAVHERTAALLAAGRTRLVIDLSKVDFMDSTGIGLLIGCAKRLRAAGGNVRLAAMQQRIMNLFVTTRLLGSAFDDYPDVEAALQSFADQEAVSTSTAAAQASREQGAARRVGASRGPSGRVPALDNRLKVDRLREKR